MQKRLEPYKGIWPDWDRITAMIELLISCSPNGFSILLGKAPPPTSLEIHQMMNATRDPMPTDYKPTTRSTETEAERIMYDAEYFEKAVKDAGGWPNIAKNANELKTVSPRAWASVADYEKFAADPVKRDNSKLKFVARRNGIVASTVLRYRQKFAYTLARMCLMPNPEPEPDTFTPSLVTPSFR